MNQINQASRAIISLARGRCIELKVTNRCMTNLAGIWEPFVYTNSPTILDSTTEKTPVSKSDETRSSSIDRKIIMTLMRKSFDRKGLKISKNRDNLVVDFFNLSKAVTDNLISVDDFVASSTFKEIQGQIEFNIDIMSNSQIVNILASVIKMRLNPTINLVKLLEHEIKFRMKKFNINQTVKMLKFYNSIELSSEQKEIVDLLSYRIRNCIQNDLTSVKDINSILHLTASQQLPSTLMPLVEERLLNILVVKDEDDIVSKYIGNQGIFDYASLCDLFIKLAENKRRPTPLLKAAATELCKLPLPDGDNKLNIELIMQTLNALISLTYPNPLLVGKLMADLTNNIELQNLGSYEMCMILRCISSLRWRSDELLEKFFKHISAGRPALLDQNVGVSLLHVCALLNYSPKTMNFKQFYSLCLGPDKEEMLKKSPRKWLNYVWSLVVLHIGDESHIRSVLSREFFQSLDTPHASVSFSDSKKLRNLQAIATIEMKLDNLNSEHLSQLEDYKIQRGIAMQKYADRVQEAVGTLMNSPEQLKCNIETQFGFNIDLELELNADLDPFHSGTSVKKFALILASYEDMIANHRNDVVGHKKVVERILKSIGYRTVFLPETLVNREKTSADLINKIKALIQDSILDERAGTSSRAHES